MACAHSLNFYHHDCWDCARCLKCGGMPKCKDCHTGNRENKKGRVKRKNRGPRPISRKENA